METVWTRSSLVIALTVPLLWVADAHACGCFTPALPPPTPTPQQATFAVNQQAEQIIFEVDEAAGKVSAHVRIFYEGQPEEFAWLLPMPNVPDLELSSSLLFGLVDQRTRPAFTRAQAPNLCPQQQYICRSHPPCPKPVTNTSPGTTTSGGFVGQSGADYGAAPAASDTGYGQAGTATIAEPPPPPPVTVIAEQQIGAYDTIVFEADEADLAVQWLNDNGFIINETMSPYMQPFLDADMVFLATRLVPGADLDEIRPLKLTYDAETPSIPLQLTAIAAEPHMTVTAFIYANQEYDPNAEPLTDVNEKHLVDSPRNNYPMLLSRAIDDAGGNAFIKEYVGPGPVFVDSTGCCSRGDDWCAAGNDGVCQCPETDFDAADCAASEEVVEATINARRLSVDYSTLTRLTTRLSPEEMVFNPEFVPARDPAGDMRLSLQSTIYSVAGCQDLVVAQQALQDVTALQAGCDATYCDFGECVMTSSGAGCVCDPGWVARSFVDSDGLASVTCVPARGTVDLAAGGIELPDACEGVDVADGRCVDVGGFAAVDCDDDLAATLGGTHTTIVNFPQCAPVEVESGGPGARNYSAALPDLDVCSVPPPTCGENAWLERFDVSITGIDCGDEPDESRFVIPPKPECPSVTATAVSNSAVPAASTSATAAFPNGSPTAAPRMQSEAPGKGAAHGLFCAVPSLRAAGSGAVGWLLSALGLLLWRRRAN